MVSFRSSLRHRSAERAQTSYRIVVPVSGSPIDRRLIEIVRKICRKTHVDVTLIYVVEVQQSMPLDAELPDEINHGEAVLREASRSARAEMDAEIGHVYTELLQARSAGAAIVDEAVDKNADAILIGAILRRQFGRLTIGDTVEYVLKNAPCEVMVIRQSLPDWITDSMEWS